LHDLPPNSQPAVLHPCRLYRVPAMCTTRDTASSKARAAPGRTLLPGMFRRYALAWPHRAGRR
jgi:hypothetical protein